MPALQALAGIPSFGGQAGQALGVGISQGINSSLSQMLESKKNQRQLSSIGKMLGIPEEDMQSFISSGIPPETAIKAAKVSQGNRSTSGTVQGSFDAMAQMVKQDLSGIGISPFTAVGADRSGVQNRAMFNSMKSSIESALLPRVNKGALSKPRFDFILSQIPDASDSQREIVGKLAGLSNALNEEGIPLNTDVLQSIDWAKDDLAKAGITSQKQAKAFSETVMMRDPSGALRRVDKKDAIAAQKEGYKLEQ